MKAELEAAKELAIRAGAILLEHYSRPSSVDWKGPGNPVTTADRSASAFLVKELRLRFPEHGILSEEEGDGPARLACSRVWVIDPMDGTKEFIARIGEFAVMIGLEIDGMASLGVVYQPTIQKLYYAAAGMGAFLEYQHSTTPLRLSPETDFSRMAIALSRSHYSGSIDLIRRRLGVQHRVVCGSIGLKIGLICEGTAHLYLHTGSRTSQWDTCAPEAILREAGGRMTDVYNAPLHYNVSETRNLHGVIASTGAIHDRIVEVTQSVLAEGL